jgi:hypothetical protein
LWISTLYCIELKMADGVVRLTGPKKQSYWVDQNTSNLGRVVRPTRVPHRCGGNWQAAAVSSSICTTAASVIISIRVVRPINLHHRLRTSSSRSKRAGQDSSPSRRAQEQEAVGYADDVSMFFFSDSNLRSNPLHLQGRTNNDLVRARHTIPYSRLIRSATPILFFSGCFRMPS